MWEVKGIPMSDIHTGEAQMEDWEPFAIEQGSLGTVIVCRRQVESTPEAQKVQDGLFDKYCKPRNAPFTKADLDCAIETARIQAIKDVAKYLIDHCHHESICYLIHPDDMESFKNGKIPE